MGSSVWFEESVEAPFQPRQEGTTSATKKSRLSRSCQRRSGPALHGPPPHLALCSRAAPAPPPWSEVLADAASPPATVSPERGLLVSNAELVAAGNDGSRSAAARPRG